MRLALAIAALVATSGCAAFISSETECGESYSLRGEPLRRPKLPEEIRSARQARLAEALAAAEERPEDLDLAIWVGRRTAYLGRYHDAIRIYSDALGRHPNSPELLRHRGHRYLTVRRFGQAVVDLRRAAELIEGTDDRVEEDGLPNARGIPTSTLHTNVYYHLGLAHYLLGEFDRAAASFGRCRERATNLDMRVATLNWEYASLARSGRLDEARALLTDVKPDWDIIENHAYHRLLLLYRGDLESSQLLRAARSPSDDESMPNLNFASTAYGVANHALLSGEIEFAQAVLREIRASGPWPAFGAIAAEVELHRHPEWLAEWLSAPDAPRARARGPRR